MELGSIRGKIQIDYDGKGVAQANSSLREVTGTAEVTANKVGSFFQGMAQGVGQAVALMAVDVAKKLLGMVKSIGRMVLGRGLDRLLNIEDARAKLRGLGHDAATVEQVMVDALNAVRGTAYGLDSAATLAATAVAAGIKPGKELERYLRLTADAATIAGSTLDEMGFILNKTTTDGRVFTDTLNQLGERGLPVMQWLQEAYGVSAVELRKMVSNGEIEAKRFREILEENIGGAALESGNTTRGAYQNMLASLGRIGANLLSGVFPHFKTFFQDTTAGLAPIEEGAARLGDTIGQRLVPIIERLGNLLSGDVGSQMNTFAGSMERAFDTAQSLAQEFGPAAVAAGGLSAALFAVGLGFKAIRRAGPVALLLAIGEVMSESYSNSEDLQDSVSRLRTAFTGETFLPSNSNFGALPSHLQEAAQSSEEIETGLLPAIEDLFVAIGQLLNQDWEGWGDAAVDAVDGVSAAVSELELVMRGEWDELDRIWDERFRRWITSGDDTGLLASYMDEAERMLEAESFADAVGAWWSTSWRQGLLFGAFESNSILREAFRQAGDILSGFFNWVGSEWSLFWRNNLGLDGWFTSMWTNFQSSWASTWNGTGSVWSSFSNWLGSEWSRFWRIDLGLGPGGWWASTTRVAGSVWSSTWRGARDTWNNFANWLGPSWSNTWRSAASLLNQSTSTMGRGWAATWRGARSAWNGFASWVGSTWSSFWRSMVSVAGMWMNNLTRLIRELPGRILSALGNTRRILWDAGVNVIQGFIDGIQSRVGSLNSLLQGITQSLPNVKGPEHVDKRILRDSGRWVMEGFEKGLLDRFPAIKGLLAKFTDDLGNFSVSSLSLESGMAQRGFSSVSNVTNAGVTYSFGPGSITLDVSKLRTIEDVVTAIQGLQSTSRQFVRR